MLTYILSSFARFQPGAEFYHRSALLFSHFHLSRCSTAFFMLGCANPKAPLLHHPSATHRVHKALCSSILANESLQHELTSSLTQWTNPHCSDDDGGDRVVVIMIMNMTVKFSSCLPPSLVIERTRSMESALHRMIVNVWRRKVVCNPTMYVCIHYPPGTERDEIRPLLRRSWNCDWSCVL